MNETSYEAIAQQYEEKRTAGSELKDLLPVKARTTGAPRGVFSVRFSASELERISSAAKRQGVTISDYIRRRALSEGPDEPHLTGAEVRAMFDRLYRELESRYPLPLETSRITRRLSAKPDRSQSGR